MPVTPLWKLRMGAEHRAQLERLAEARHDGNRSAAVRALIAEAYEVFASTPAPEPEAATTK